jgi:transposase-like protein
VTLTRSLIRTEEPSRRCRRSPTNSRPDGACQIAQSCEGQGDLCSRATTELLDETETGVLTDMTFPVTHRAKLYSTNPLERLKGVTRRTEVACHTMTRSSG